MIQSEAPIYKDQTISITELAHARVSEILSEGDVAIDATVGNGHDSLWLAQSVGSKGLVFGFEIQQDALMVARNRLFQAGVMRQVQVYQTSHANIQSQIPKSYHGKVKGIVFNLGYLPGGDKHITTETESTIAALSQAYVMLVEGGILSIACYPGHHEGIDETNHVKQWVESLNPKETITHHYIPEGTKRRPPELYLVLKQSSEKRNLTEKLKKLFCLSS